MVSALPLAELQRCLFAALRGDDHAEATNVVTELAGDARLDAGGRLDIYKNMYVARIVEALCEAFPALVVLLGDDDFTDVATAYLRAHPSRDPSLRNVGANLPPFLADVTCSGAGALPVWVAELATLEWHRYDLFDGTDAQPLNRVTLSAMAPEAFASLVLRPMPTVRRLDLRYSVDLLWQSLTLTPDAEPEAPEPLATPRRVVLWRDGTSIFHRVLDPREAYALDLLAAEPSGIRFDALCDALLAGGAEATANGELDEGAFAHSLFTMLGRWTTDGLLRT